MRPLLGSKAIWAVLLGAGGLFVGTALLGPPGSPVGAVIPWEDLTEADWAFSILTRIARVDGRDVHYPTPTEELESLLEKRTETEALRYLAAARRDLGDRAGALQAMKTWAARVGPEGGAEAARFAAALGDHAAAIRLAMRAWPRLPARQRRALMDEAIAWADTNPRVADPLDLRAQRAAAFPRDAAALDDWVRALREAGRPGEAGYALQHAPSLAPRERLMRLVQMHDADGNRKVVLALLEREIPTGWDDALAKAWAAAVESELVGGPAGWRETLESGWDRAAFARLAAYYLGRERADAAVELLGQMERRYGDRLERTDWRLISEAWLHAGDVPQAFRARLSGALRAKEQDQEADLAALSRLALQAGTALPWGSYRDEPLRLVARMDRTPGFWTGGLSLLLTGQSWEEALSTIEERQLPDLTFATARTLASELARRNPGHPELPDLQVRILERHLERGEAEAVLAGYHRLAPGAPADVLDRARRVVLSARRAIPGDLVEEIDLYRSCLAYRASLESSELVSSDDSEDPEPEGEWVEDISDVSVSRAAADAGSYRDLLAEAIARLEERDPSHRASLRLIVGEMDRHPDEEGLWRELADRLQTWGLDDELGPRYARALRRFRGHSWWARLARFYMKRQRHDEMLELGHDLVASFRGSELFGRAAAGEDLVLPLPDQPSVDGAPRLVTWADLVRLRALERFPHSPRVFDEAHQALLRRSVWQRGEEATAPQKPRAPVVEDALLDRRRDAVLFADAGVRETFFREAVVAGRLDDLIGRLAAAPDRTPVHDLLLRDGLARLSRFEEALPAAAALASAYPGDPPHVKAALSLHRSLSALDPAQAGKATLLVARSADAVPDAVPLYTELGELHEEAGRPAEAVKTWGQIVSREPRSAARVEEVATVLWDYQHMAEALEVVSEGRKRLGDPGLLAFEAGVLQEEVGDMDAAVAEYLRALEGAAGSWDAEQRAARRLAELLGRPRAREIALSVLAAVKPGVAAEEERFLSLLHVVEVSESDLGDAWTDAEDMPNDPVGQDEAEERRDARRSAVAEGIAAVRAAALAKTMELAERATRAGLLDDLLDRWQRVSPPLSVDESFRLDDAARLRRAELASSEAERVRLHVERVNALAAVGRFPEADAAWEKLLPMVAALPDGVDRLRAQAGRAGYLETAGRPAEAVSAWESLSAAAPWSLGVLEDRMTFLARQGQAGAARALLESASAEAAPGRKEVMLERLAGEALQGGDLEQARRAVAALLAVPSLQTERRLQASHLLGRLALRADRKADLVALARQESAKVPRDRQADLWRELALAADAEEAWDPAATLWIEALNRRLERAWIRDAVRAAAGAGRAKGFLSFFEEQQARSPRDVRWAVAVRDIRLHQGDLEGAIVMARTAVKVRPEKEELWHDLTDLLVRAGRPGEAGDVLRDLQKVRPSREDVAIWRSQLHARAGDGAAALDAERVATDAHRREEPDDEVGLSEREARAAWRLRSQGLPDQALELLGGDVEALAGSGLDDGQKAELALAADVFVEYLDFLGSDEQPWLSAASVLKERGSPELRSSVLRRLLEGIDPGEPSSTVAIATAWPFVRNAGLESEATAELARRWIAAEPGPWQEAPSEDLVNALAPSMVAYRSDEQGRSRPVVERPSIAAVYARELARADRGPDLVAFLDPAFQELLARVRSSDPLPEKPDVPAVSLWLRDPGVLAAFTRELASRPGGRDELAAVMTDPGRVGRLWALGGSGWALEPLLLLLGPDARVSFIQNVAEAGRPASSALDRAREATLGKVSVAIDGLLAGIAGSPSDPLVRRLRGPRRVGEVLGTDAGFTWPELAPRRDSAGRIQEQGVHRVTGQGVDAGRLPGALWGEAPGDAWLVLETLARYRERGAAAAWVTMESAAQATTSRRALVGMRLAERLGRPDDALAIDRFRPAAQLDAARVALRSRLLAGRGRTDEAAGELAREIRRRQRELTEHELREATRLARELGLPEPVGMLDPAVPVQPELLAYLHERYGSAVAGKLSTADAYGLRSALRERWAERRDRLGTDELAVYLKEVWASGSGPFPHRGVRTLPGLWPHAADWLESISWGSRPQAVAALLEGSLPEIELLLARQPQDTARQLLVRVHLERGEEGKALALVEEALKEMEGERPLSYEPDGSASYDQQENEEAPDVDEGGDPLARRIRGWLAPLRERKHPRAPEAAARMARLLRRHYERGAVAASIWDLALELAGATDRDTVLGAMDLAYVRGDIHEDTLLPLAESLARRHPAGAARWLARVTPAWDGPSVRRRAAVLERLEDRAGACRLLEEALSRGVLDAREELEAFDAWRRLGAGTPAAPEAWRTAQAFWAGDAAAVPAQLATHLAAAPLDVRAARAALRSAGPADPGGLLRAARALAGAGLLSGTDDTVLRVRRARAALPGSPRAAAAILGRVGVPELHDELSRRRFPAAEVDAALADIARIAARGGDGTTRDAALDELDLRKSPVAAALHAELKDAVAVTQEPPRAYRIEGGKPALLLPRDLDWPLLERLLLVEVRP